MLTVGDVFTFEYQIPESKVVPNLYPESPEFQAIPPVFATGFMVGLLEWTCIKSISTQHCRRIKPALALRLKQRIVLHRHPG
ncbi:hypothetical protein [Corynebacterium freiburgense]|uniref:hypothetical protein n=1 Tax=Corynebacterium freiburgense TaxID=556548 RepID=UPI000411B636|nr:hypothetical protein [Corynebacterium freiburgense]WJZ03537.1 Fluoroacetyl-CoA thioesterase [Corynebacterium freiburgense]